MKPFDLTFVRTPRWLILSLASMVVALVVTSLFGVLPETESASVVAAERERPSLRKSSYTVLGYNDLGMHCMNQDFSEICILPPFNTLRAQVILRGEEPKIVSDGLTVAYSIPGNTTSTTKTDFWSYEQLLFGVDLPVDVGLTGNGLAGTMVPSGNRDWVATGIPATPLTDQFQNDPFQLSQILVKNKRGKVVASTEAVVPVSWEISCNLCHNTEGISVATDMLRAHDRLHGTTLEAQKPVLCASCHADPALGTPGAPGVSSFSHAMHGAHASRMGAVSFLNNTCYACHPGVQTECQRDVHLPLGITCINCHGDMYAVANPARTPWVDEPTCAQCHNTLNPRYKYEEPGKSFKDSRGHGGVFCAACHGPQHAVGPAATAPDNAQAILQQGHAGTINDCTVCHTKRPDDPFFHSRTDD
ncbi:hypothetical protein GC163_20260 [bacterium]|nr:hypothetical protein [bacterium]